MFTSSVEERRWFYRRCSWFLMVLWILYMLNEGKEKLLFDNKFLTKSFIDWAFESGVYWNINLLFITVYLDYCLLKAENYLIAFLESFIAESKDWKMEYDHSSNSNWLLTMLYVEVVTPFFCFIQYFNAFCIYYGDLEEDVRPSINSPPILIALWVLTTLSCLDAFVRVVYWFLACLLYRHKWFSRCFGPDVYEEDLDWLIHEIQGFPDWVFFLHLWVQYKIIPLSTS
ncbi:unnamed protein product [Nezara viridula]|uniref:Uncharacterized protein n=1 Tax=Nezara viridula TaxID=85310 RepID=A0A9P0ED42_NEZVI|nr:unnamed protein product [Nezara viridula]